jgi:hypothetical protein
MQLSSFGLDWEDEQSWFNRLADAQARRFSDASLTDTRPLNLDILACQIEYKLTMKQAQAAEPLCRVYGTGHEHWNPFDDLRTRLSSLKPKNQNNGPQSSTWVEIKPPFPLMRLPLELRVNVLEYALDGVRDIFVDACIASDNLWWVGKSLRKLYKPGK